MSARGFTIDVGVRVEVDIHDADVIERITGSGGDEWRSQFYPLHDAADVMEHIAFNAILNGVTDVSRLEGWGDLPSTAASITVCRDIETDVRPASSPGQETP